MALKPADGVELKRVKGKGRGVFACRPIAAGEVIERAPILVLPRDLLGTEDQPSALHDYCFEWGDGTVALALGFGSLYNHSYDPNARYDDEGFRTKVFTALRDIAPGEEVTINYNGDPDDRSPVWFEVIEDGRTGPRNGSRHRRRGPVRARRP